MAIIITAEQLKQIVIDRIEPDEPVNTIYAVLKEHDGKRLDKRVIDKIIEATRDDSI